MGFHSKVFQEQTGLHFDAASMMFHGVSNGYPVFVQKLERQSALLVHTYVKQAAMIGTEPVNLEAWYQQWRNDHIGIADVHYSGVHLTAMITIPKKEADSRTVMDFCSFTESLRQNELIACCGGCGTEQDIHPHSYNGAGICLCPHCAETLIQRSEENKNEKNAVKAKPWGIALGALIGGASLFLITLLLRQFNLIAYASGLLGIIISIVAIRKFAGKLSVGGAVTAIAVCVVISIFTPFIGISQEYAEFYREQLASDEIISLQQDCKDIKSLMNELEDDEMEEILGSSRAELEDTLQIYDSLFERLETHQTTKECFFDLGTLLSGEENSQNRSSLLKDILWGVLPVLLSAFFIMPKVWQDDNGIYTFRRLDT